jgi:hypothetical protein
MLKDRGNTGLEASVKLGILVVSCSIPTFTINLKIMARSSEKNKSSTFLPAQFEYLIRQAE